MTVVRRLYRHPYAPLAAFLLLIALFSYSVWQLERQRAAGVVAFCTTEFDTRLIMADTLSILADDPDDTPADDARERGVADRVEVRLQSLPDRCTDYVDPAAITIDVE